jgi:hypothetical protein
MPTAAKAKLVRIAPAKQSTAVMLRTSPRSDIHTKNEAE